MEFTNEINALLMAQKTEKTIGKNLPRAGCTNAG